MCLQCMMGAMSAGAGASGARFPIHVELFADARVVVVPAGIGITGSSQRHGNRTRAGHCYAAMITTDASGVVDVAAGERRPTLDELFAIWGQRLSASTLAG